VVRGLVDLVKKQLLTQLTSLPNFIDMKEEWWKRYLTKIEVVTKTKVEPPCTADVVLWGDVEELITEAVKRYKTKE